MMGDTAFSSNDGPGVEAWAGAVRSTACTTSEPVDMTTIIGRRI